MATFSDLSTSVVTIHPATEGGGFVDTSNLSPVQFLKLSSVTGTVSAPDALTMFNLSGSLGSGQSLVIIARDLSVSPTPGTGVWKVVNDAVPTESSGVVTIAGTELKSIAALGSRFMYFAAVKSGFSYYCWNNCGAVAFWDDLSVFMNHSTEAATVQSTWVSHLSMEGTSDNYIEVDAQTTCVPLGYTDSKSTSNERRYAFVTKELQGATGANAGKATGFKPSELLVQMDTGALDSDPSTAVVHQYLDILNTSALVSGSLYNYMIFVQPGGSAGFTKAWFTVESSSVAPVPITLKLNLSMSMAVVRIADEAVLNAEDDNLVTAVSADGEDVAVATIALSNIVPGQIIGTELVVRLEEHTCAHDDKNEVLELSNYNADTGLWTISVKGTASFSRDPSYYRRTATIIVQDKVGTVLNFPLVVDCLQSLTDAIASMSLSGGSTGVNSRTADGLFTGLGNDADVNGDDAVFDSEFAFLKDRSLKAFVCNVPIAYNPEMPSQDAQYTTVTVNQTVLQNSDGENLDYEVVVLSGLRHVRFVGPIGSLNFEDAEDLNTISVTFRDELPDGRSYVYTLQRDLQATNVGLYSIAANWITNSLVVTSTNTHYLAWYEESGSTTGMASDDHQFGFHLACTRYTHSGSSGVAVSESDFLASLHSQVYAEGEGNPVFSRFIQCTNVAQAGNGDLAMAVDFSTEDCNFYFRFQDVNVSEYSCSATISHAEYQYLTMSDNLLYLIPTTPVVKYTYQTSSGGKVTEHTDTVLSGIVKVKGDSSVTMADSEYTDLVINDQELIVKSVRVLGVHSRFFVGCAVSQSGESVPAGVDNGVRTEQEDKDGGLCIRCDGNYYSDLNIQGKTVDIVNTTGEVHNAGEVFIVSFPMQVANWPSDSTKFFQVKQEWHGIVTANKVSMAYVESSSFPGHAYVSITVDSGSDVAGEWMPTYNIGWVLTLRNGTGASAVDLATYSGDTFQELQTFLQTSIPDYVCEVKSSNAEAKSSYIGLQGTETARCVNSLKVRILNRQMPGHEEDLAIINITEHLGHAYNAFLPRYLSVAPFTRTAMKYTSNSLRTMFTAFPVIVTYQQPTGGSDMPVVVFREVSGTSINTSYSTD